MNAVATAAIAAGALMAAAVAVLAVGEYRLVTRLRRDHPRTWEGLGSPSPWFTRWQDLSAVTRFLTQRDYEKLGDVELAVLANKLRILTRVVYVLVAATLLLLSIARLAAKR